MTKPVQNTGFSCILDIEFGGFGAGTGIAHIPVPAKATQPSTPKEIQMKSMKMIKKAQAGFTLIELMIVVAIIGILAAIAIPQYNNYVSRTRAAGAMAELGSVKSAIAMCIQELGTKTGCSAGSNGIPSPAITKNIISVESITDGKISVTTGATNGATNLTITDTPTLGAASVTWLNDGSSCDASRGFKSGAGDCA